MYGACVATGILSLLFSVLYLLVLFRATLCPGCCVFAAKEVLPISEEHINSKYVTPPESDEAKMLIKLLQMTGLRKVQPINPLDLPDIEQIQRNRTERREATPLYLAWYKFTAKR